MNWAGVQASRSSTAVRSTSPSRHSQVASKIAACICMSLNLMVVMYTSRSFSTLFFLGVSPLHKLASNSFSADAKDLRCEDSVALFFSRFSMTERSSQLLVKRATSTSSAKIR